MKIQKEIREEIYMRIDLLKAIEEDRNNVYVLLLKEKVAKQLIDLLGLQ